MEAVRGRDGGGFLVELADRTYEAGQVVVATGPFQVPFTPPIAADLGAQVVQLHSTQYRSPEDLPPGTVLVVGGGNTGYQISQELAQSRDVHLAIGARQTPLPQRILGRDLFRYLQATGLMNKTVDSRLVQRLKDKETLSAPALVPRASSASRCGRAQPAPARRPSRSPTARSSRSTGWCGRPASGSTTPSCSCRSSTTGTGPPPAWRHRNPRPVLPRPSLAAHPRLGAAGLGQRRRAVHRPAHRRVRPEPRHSVGFGALRSAFAMTWLPERRRQMDHRAIPTATDAHRDDRRAMNDSRRRDRSLPRALPRRRPDS